MVVRNDLTIVRRATGGPAIRMRKGQLFVSLALRAADALGGVADVNRALNRHVRPLLAALTSVGSSAATYGGRDFVSMAGAPVSWVGVRHLRETGLVAIEAIVAVDAPFAIDPELDLAHGAIAPRFLGKIATSLCAVAHRDVEIERVARAVVDAYCAEAGGDVAKLELTLPVVNAIDIEEPPFDAMVEESIGLLGARIELQQVALGGDWMISEDIVTPLGRALFALGAEVSDDALFRTIDEHLSPSAHTLLVGVKQLSSIAKLVRAAWAATKTTTRG